jgi:hypothetical protein
MAMQELTQMEVMEVSGGDRSLGTLYQYTGDASDRTFGERFTDSINAAITGFFSIELWLWRN